jgi:hypothetical protein
MSRFVRLAIANPFPGSSFLWHFRWLSAISAVAANSRR